MPHEQLSLRAAEGPCEAHFFTPPGEGPWPAVLLYMDGPGMRPALHGIARRIAAEGYAALLPDLFYRTGFRVNDPMIFFKDAAFRAEWMTKIVPTVAAPLIMADTEHFFDFFKACKDVKPGAIGITGYCMGGRLSVYAAGHFGDRVAAAGSFHPGGLATDQPESPHRLADRIEATLYIAGAIDDKNFDDAQKDRLRAAFDAADVDYTLETYPAHHGWVPSDTPAHDPEQAERHYQNLFSLFGRTLQS
jgi:carboxymethylenebutenolidase